MGIAGWRREICIVFPPDIFSHFENSNFRTEFEILKRDWLTKRSWEVIRYWKEKGMRKFKIEVIDTKGVPDDTIVMIANDALGEYFRAMEDGCDRRALRVLREACRDRKVVMIRGVKGERSWID